MSDPLTLAFNRSELSLLRPGDLIQFPRGVYSHWGVYLGDKKVGHLAGEDNDGLNAGVRPQHLFTISGVPFGKARVAIDDFWTVADGKKAIKNNKHDGKDGFRAFRPQEIISRVRERIGVVGYNLIYQNCEHFACWCRYGIEKSEQVDNVVTGISMGVAAGAVLGLVYAVSKYWGNSEEEEEQQTREGRLKNRQRQIEF